MVFQARVVRPAVVLTSIALAALIVPAVLQAKSNVAVDMELSQQFYYAGNALTVRLSIGNPSNKKIDNPIRSPLFGGFKVKSRDGQVLQPTGTPSVEEPARPEKLAPGSFYGAVVDVSEIYPELSRPGMYQIYWSSDGALSEMLIVTIIPRYDPDKQYQGAIETPYGPITIDFYQDQAPIAVKSFIDMASSGFYDGLQFHEVHADDYVVAGDPRFVTPPRRSITYPAEQSTIPLVAGSIVMKPAGAAPPANGSTFVILLKPQAAWTGQVTVLGQVTSGLEIVQRISREPSSMRGSQPYFKPLKEIPIERVRVVELAPRQVPGP